MLPKKSDNYRRPPGAFASRAHLTRLVELAEYKTVWRLDNEGLAWPNIGYHQALHIHGDAHPFVGISVAEKGEA